MHRPLPILLYRRIVAAPDPLTPGALEVRHFERHLAWLQRWCRILPLHEAARRLRAHALPPRSVCLTFENVCAAHATLVLPLLQRHGVTATFFVASGALDGQAGWRDTVIELVRSAAGPRLCLARAGFGNFDVGCLQRRRALIELLLAALSSLPALERMRRMAHMAHSGGPAALHSDQLLALHRAGMGIGACTVNEHPLARLSNAEARAEIANGRSQLEQIVQAPVTLFSYPNGSPGADFERRHANMLRCAGFEAAVTTATAAARHDSDPYALPRCTPKDSSGAPFVLALAHQIMRGQQRGARWQTDTAALERAQHQGTGRGV
ncbi:MAG TPA: polysaccharide deacetylase family protein [Telluria sp.]